MSGATTAPTTASTLMGAADESPLVNNAQIHSPQAAYAAWRAQHGSVRNT